MHRTTIVVTHIICALSYYCSGYLLVVGLYNPWIVLYYSDWVIKIRKLIEKTMAQIFEKQESPIFFMFFAIQRKISLQ